MISQVVPMLHAHDAVGRHTMALQAELVARGIESAVYVELEDPDTGDRTRPFAEYLAADHRDDVTVYQFATASTVADALFAHRQRLVVNYHNVTPPECFAAWDDALANHQLWAQLQLAMLGGVAVLGVGVSEHNRADLVAAGFSATAVVPPAVDLPAPGHPHRAPSPAGARWLAVGRIAPNKTLEATLAALFVYRLRHDPGATLEVVGRPSLPSYARALRRYAADLGLADAVRFAGRVDDAALDACYDRADVLVVSSVHEGFCLPAVEAMARGLPVVAYREGAISEVVGDGGVLVDGLDPVVVSDAVRSVVAGPRRGAVAEAGGRQVKALKLDDAAGRLADLLVALHDDRPWPATVVRHEPPPPGG